jgi:hypothetical protein
MVFGIFINFLLKLSTEPFTIVHSHEILAAAPPQPLGITLEGGTAMPLSVSQLIASTDTAGDALRLIRAAKDLTQADIVARAEGTIDVDQISLTEHGKRPMTSKQ